MEITLKNAPQSMIDLIAGIAKRNRYEAAQKIGELEQLIDERRQYLCKLEQEWTIVNHELEEFLAQKKECEDEMALTTILKDPATGVWSIKTPDEESSGCDDEFAKPGVKLGRERDAQGRFRKANG